MVILGIRIGRQNSIKILKRTESTIQVKHGRPVFWDRWLSA